MGEKGVAIPSEGEVECFERQSFRETGRGRVLFAPCGKRKREKGGIPSIKPRGREKRRGKERGEQPPGFAGKRGKKLYPCQEVGKRRRFDASNWGKKNQITLAGWREGEKGERTNLSTFEGGVAACVGSEENQREKNALPFSRQTKKGRERIGLSLGYSARKKREGVTKSGMPSISGGEKRKRKKLPVSYYADSREKGKGMSIPQPGKARAGSS